MGNNSETKDVTNKPCIHAGDMSPKELRDWLNDLAKSANRTDSFWARAIDDRLRGMTVTARDLVDELAEKVNFLQCREIRRSEDHTSAIQADLLHCQGMLKIVSDFLRAVEQYRTQDIETPQISSDLTHKDEIQ
ncbi:TPA: hypothetical protein G9F27_005547 [Salmonella enterica]|uniref:Uncharacterized protein n=1 Tax=Salmonella enterica TaxID=28901 RepID=A0A743SQR3_SALER|nr:hypothetical protein [Salmonella enterica]